MQNGLVNKFDQNINQKGSQIMDTNTKNVDLTYKYHITLLKSCKKGAIDPNKKKQAFRSNETGLNITSQQGRLLSLDEDQGTSFCGVFSCLK